MRRAWEIEICIAEKPAVATALGTNPAHAHQDSPSHEAIGRQIDPRFPAATARAQKIPACAHVSVRVATNLSMRSRSLRQAAHLQLPRPAPAAHPLHRHFATE